MDFQYGLAAAHHKLRTHYVWRRKSLRRTGAKPTKSGNELIQDQERLRTSGQLLLGTED